MCLELDLAKAYDSIQWEFLQATMIAMEFQNYFIKLILECVQYPSYSILLNGTLVGYFKVTRVSVKDALYLHLFFLL